MAQQLEHASEEYMTQNTVALLWPAVTLLIGIFAIGMDELVISPLLIDVSNTFHSSLSVTALSVSIYGLTIAISAPIVSPLGDQIPRRTLMLGTLVGFIVASAVCAVAPNMLVLLIGRALSGMAAGAFVPSAYAYVGDSVPFTHRGRVMGVVLSGWAAALVIGVPFGGWVGGQLGWRATFVSIAILAVVATCLMFRLPQVHAVTDSSVQAREHQSFMQACWKVVQIPGVLPLVFVTFCDMFGFYGAYTFLGSFVRSSQHFGTAAAGELIIPYGIGFALSPLTGRFADRFGHRRSLLIALFLLAAVLTSLPHLGQSVLFLTPVLLVWGIGQSTALTTLSTLLTEASQEHRGQVMGLYSFATNMAVALGSSLMGSIYTMYGYVSVGMVCAVISLIGAVLTITLRDN
ncbi:MFS transporter [Alicyclobacillus macrosporangiidus]|uniref:MFS transporter n=1 Tax=Alicyclobacillus macrosporangiidus TaxID=392015 RepID=UPI000A823E40|nr:MFS transporter [Alicyclobacillus macrosporangiidus]